MKITGEHLYQVSQDRLWQALNDHHVLARILPGCEDLKQTAENQLAGRLKIKVGPVQGVFDGTVVLEDLDPPNGYRMQIDGKGAPGFVKGTGAIRLEAQGEGTLLHYDIDAQVGGRIAGVGQRLLDSSAKVITRQGLTGLEAQLAGEPASSEASPNDSASSSASQAPNGPSGAARPAPPSQAAFARDFLVGLAGELVPKERRPLVIAGAVLLVLIVVAVILRTCG